MMDFGVGMDLGRVQQFSCLLFSRSLFLLQGRRSASCRWGGCATGGPVTASCSLVSEFCLSLPTIKVL